MLRLFDTANGQVRELALREPGKVSMYVCGPTVYDVPHIGHGRAVLVYDVLRRYLAWTGLEVHHVSNITDIDDKIIQRATEEERASDRVAGEYEQAYWDALDQLGVLRPTDAPRATAYVKDMVELIGRLVDDGFAYELPDGVYFSADKVPDYGLLARQTIESLRAGARVEVGEGKRSPVDFVLWKKAKPGEPAWPSPWGDGRPGWHTECVVMSLDLLGDGFDLHTGGLDLMFPHHENERAQAVALGKLFAKHWMHHAFVEVEGQKMSKSLKNFTSLTDLLARHDGRAYRLLILRSHYRSPLEVTPVTIADAEDALDRLDTFARRTAHLEAQQPIPAVVEQFRARMDDDLDTPGAVALLFDSVRQGNAALDAGDVDKAAAHLATVQELCGAVGLELKAAADEVDAATRALMAERDGARAARDWARADAIRNQLQEQGWIVEDGAEGTTVRRA